MASGQEVPPGTTSPGRVSGVSALCLCCQLKIPKDDMLCFQPEGAKEKQPFQNQNSPAVCFILEHSKSRLRTQLWAVNASYPAPTAPFPCQKKKKKSKPRDWWIVKIIVELGYKALGKQMIAWDHGPVNQCHRTPLTLFFGHQPSGLCSTRDRCYWIIALFPQHVEAI